MRASPGQTARLDRQAEWRSGWAPASRPRPEQSTRRAGGVASSGPAGTRSPPGGGMCRQHPILGAFGRHLLRGLVRGGPWGCSASVITRASSCDPLFDLARLSLRLSAVGVCPGTRTRAWGDPILCLAPRKEAAPIPRPGPLPPPTSRAAAADESSQAASLCLQPPCLFCGPPGPRASSRVTPRLQILTLTTPAKSAPHVRRCAPGFWGLGGFFRGRYSAHRVGGPSSPAEREMPPAVQGPAGSLWTRCQRGERVEDQAPRWEGRVAR